MKKILYSALAIVAGLSLSTFAQTQNNKMAKLGNDTIKKVIEAMTLEEKAYFVTGTGMNMPGAPGSADKATTPGVPVVGQSQNLVPGAAGTTHPISRLGVTAMVMADGPAGLRISPTRPNNSKTYYCTAFPVASLLSSTWDADLVFKVGQAMGNEVLEYGADILLGPAMNIHRNPLCGRNFEYFSEDPLITGKIGASMVNGVQSQGVGTSIKHFAANNAETNRNALNTIVSERALREIYLEGYRIAIEEAQPWTVMSSYNLINDTHASENYGLLTKILRDDWRFKGFVMTDWFGGVDPVAQMKAGNDLLMPGNAVQAQAIIKAVQEKKLDEAILDRNVERILDVLVRSPRFKNYQYTSKPDMTAHAKICRESATEGMVLLKNNNAALPLSLIKTKNMAAFGNTSYEIITGGTGSGDVNEAYSISLADGLKGAGFALNGDLQKAYEAYLLAANAKRPQTRQFILKAPIAEMPVDSALVSRIAEIADIALITIGRNSGEGSDRKVENDFDLSDAEKKLIKTVVDAFHAKSKKAIAVLNVGGVIETASWRDMPDAILLAWQAGQEAGNAIADVISGKVNPSGKLASTFPMKYTDAPSSKSFPGVILQGQQPPAGVADEDPISIFQRPRPSRIVYEEGIYVGYRYYESFGIKPAYEFGYGLSYTTFEFSGLSLSSKSFSGKMSASVNVKNAGAAAGREVVQLYINAPAKKLNKPSIELKGFVKTRLLQPGESQTITFTLTPRSLSSFDPVSSSWTAEAGAYEIKIGASSRDIRQKADFKLGKNLIVKKESIALVPNVRINEIKP